jgi:hypothetical protein
MAPPRVATWGGAFFRADKIGCPSQVRPSAGESRGRHAAVRVHCLPMRVRIANRALVTPDKNFAKSDFSGLLDAGNPVGRGLCLEESPAGALASRRPPSNPAGSYLDAAGGSFLPSPAELRFTFLKGL